MSKAKDEILNNIGDALRNVPNNENQSDVFVPRDYNRESNLSEKEIVSLFKERVSEYKATVKQVDTEELRNTIVQSCKGEAVKKLVVPCDFPKDYLPHNLDLFFDRKENPLSNQELDEMDGAITMCGLAVAQTGTIILDAGKGQGRRVITLLPDYHLCILRKSQIVELVPEGFAHFESVVQKDGRPITFISGPSATSDIELSRVEGVHGPRRLEVLVVESSKSNSV